MNERENWGRFRGQEPLPKISSRDRERERDFMAPLVALLFVVKTIIRSVGPSHSAKVQQLPAEWQNNESIFALFSPPPDRGFPRIARFWSRSNTSWIYFLTKNSPTPASYSFIFGLFKQTIQYLQQINEKNVHPVYGLGFKPMTFWTWVITE